MRSASVPRYPDFMILGAAKCGTTSLHHALARHPEILMSDPKEPFFFEAEYEEGLEAYWRRYFSHWRGQRLIGESRHRNLYLPYVPARIHALAPAARFLAILRDPVTRAYSHWWHWFRTAREDLYFEEALWADLERIDSGRRLRTPEEIAEYAARLDRKGKGPYRTYLDSGYYAEQLERYFRIFDPGRFKVLIFEEMARDPAAAVREVCEFLGADPAGARSIEPAPTNASQPMRFGPAARWAWRRLTAGKTPPGRSAWPAPPLLVWKRPPMDGKIRAWLEEHYAPHNRRLEALLGRSLNLWNGE